MVIDAIAASQEAARRGRATIKQLEKQRGEDGNSRYAELVASAGEDANDGLFGFGRGCAVHRRVPTSSRTAFQTTMNVSGLGKHHHRFRQGARPVHPIAAICNARTMAVAYAS